MTNIEKVRTAFENADEQTKEEVLKLLGVKDDGKFIPKQGDKYYYIADNGKVYSYVWDVQYRDHHRLLMGNVYRTREEAKQALDFQTRKAKLIKEIEDSSDVIDWDNINQYKYRYWLNRCNNSLRVSGYIYGQIQGAAYTTNEQFLEELINTRSDEVKELLFGLKENK